MPLLLVREGRPHPIRIPRHNDNPRWSSLLLLMLLACTAPAVVTSQQQRICGMQTPGTLIIDGGGFDRSPWSATGQAILQHLSKSVDQAEMVLIVAGGEELDDDERDEFTELWTDDDGMGFDEDKFTILHPEEVDSDNTGVEDAEEANSRAFVEPLLTADVMFIKGGRQHRLVDALKYTRTHDEMWNLLERGGVLAGTSAGATSQGFFMPRGDPDGSSTLVADSEWHRYGFGFLPGVALDVHVDARDRWEDLYEVLEEEDPTLLGIGISESAAIVVQGNYFTVVGDDGWDSMVAVYSCNNNKDDCNEDDAPYLLLYPGDWYDLCNRDVVSEPSSEDRLVPSARHSSIPYAFETDYRLAGPEFRCSGRHCRWISSPIETGGDTHFRLSADLIGDGGLEDDDYLELSYRFGVEGGDYSNWVTIHVMTGGVDYEVTADIFAALDSGTLQFRIRAETSDEGGESYIVRSLAVERLPDTSAPTSVPTSTPTSSPSFEPTLEPTREPTLEPTFAPSSLLSMVPTATYTRLAPTLVNVSSWGLSTFTSTSITPFSVKMVLDEPLSGEQIDQSFSELQHLIADYLLTKLSDDDFGTNVALTGFNLTASLHETVTLIQQRQRQRRTQEEENLFNRDKSRTAYTYHVEGTAQFHSQEVGSSVVDVDRASSLLNSAISALFADSESQSEFTNFIANHKDSHVLRNPSDFVVVASAPQQESSGSNHLALILGVVGGAIVIVALILLFVMFRGRCKKQKPPRKASPMDMDIVLSTTLPMVRSDTNSDDSTLFKFDESQSDGKGKQNLSALDIDSLHSILDAPHDEIALNAFDDSGKEKWANCNMLGAVSQHSEEIIIREDEDVRASKRALRSRRESPRPPPAASNRRPPRDTTSIPSVIHIQQAPPEGDAQPKEGVSEHLTANSNVLRLVGYSPPRCNSFSSFAAAASKRFMGQDDQHQVRRTVSYSPSRKKSATVRFQVDNLPSDDHSLSSGAVIGEESDDGDDSEVLAGPPPLSLLQRGLQRDVALADEEEVPLKVYEKKRATLRVKEEELRKKLADAYSRYRDDEEARKV